MLTLGCWAPRSSHRAQSQQPGELRAHLAPTHSGLGTWASPSSRMWGRTSRLTGRWSPWEHTPWPQAGTAHSVGVAGLPGAAPGAAPPSCSRGAHAHGLGARMPRLLGPRGG